MDVVAACQANFARNAGNCSGFVRAVAADLGIAIDPNANADGITDTLRAGPPWAVLADGLSAADAAADGKFVVAGLRGDEQAKPDEHGHVVVVVAGPLAHDKYPTAWWGSLGGHPGQGQTLNWAWNTQDRDNITYAAQDLPG